MTEWKRATEAPRDGTVVLMNYPEQTGELGFYQWKFNKWVGEECFTSLDEDGSYSIPTSDLDHWVYRDDVQPPKE